MEKRNSIAANTVIGIIVMLVGGLFLARNFDFFPGEYLRLIFTWQSILIVIGIITYLSSGNKPLGVIIASVGILGFIPNFWALLLIGLGGYIIYRNQSKPSDENMHESVNAANEGDYINDISIFGGSKKSFQVDNFRGGNITAIFGGSEINMIDSSLCDGISTLNLFFLFGGTSIRVPSNWNVYIQLTPIFGGFKDKRILVSDDKSTDKKLVIRGFVLFGGGDLKN